jgi:hypothetical protein
VTMDSGAFCLKLGKGAGLNFRGAAPAVLISTPRIGLLNYSSCFSYSIQAVDS